MSCFHIEIVQEHTSTLSKRSILTIVCPFLESLVSLTSGEILTKHDFRNHEDLQSHIKAISFCDTNRQFTVEDVNSCEIRYHVYRLDQLECDTENMENEDNDEQLPAANHWQLPSKDFFGLWETLIYDTKVKDDTLSYIETALLFSDKGIDTNIISWNRVILLHGPPGTGKTSLCKALAQKLSIRLGNRYKRGQLVEINSHSLFSKWFSESGKLVLKLFKKIRQLMEDPEVLVCVLIDEVESLTHARTVSLAGSEPSDSIRVVNAVLTQLDQIRHSRNVIILTTSNMTGAIDLAFVDRADIKQYVGLPSAVAIYQIYLSCINELQRTGIISPAAKLYPFITLKSCNFALNDNTKESIELLDVAKSSVGLSGRNLRKIPFLAHALHIDEAFVDLGSFLKAMKTAVKRQHSEKHIFENTEEIVNTNLNNISIN